MSVTEEKAGTTLRMAVYDPLQLNETDFLNTFVARLPLLNRMLRHIAESGNQTILHHRLVFGQRGMGKTSLLRRIALAVRDDHTLSQAWIPLNFREEQYNIGQLNDFWKNCADALADWCEKNGKPAQAESLDHAVRASKDLYRDICAVADANSRRLILLVDNLNLILDSLAVTDQWALRKSLLDKHAPLMIACTPTHLPQLSQREGPFYDFFSMDDLGALDSHEMKECLVRLARTRGKPGLDVLLDMQRHPQRIRVMHTLCGGNPRTLVLIYQVLETIAKAVPDDGGDMGQLLEGVLETTTPLYKSRTEELSQQQRRVIDAVALAWDPISSAEISKTTGIVPTTLSGLINRLKKDGLLERVSMGPKRNGVQLAERFYNIWYLMRHGTRRNRLRLQWLSRFLSTYYSKTELGDQARQLIARENTCRNLYSDALLHAMDHDAPLQQALRTALTKPLIGKTPDFIQNLLPGEDYEPKILDHDLRRKKMAQGFITAGASPSDAGELAQQVSESIGLSLKSKQRYADFAKDFDVTQQKKLSDFLYSETQRIKKVLGDTPYKKVSALFRDGILTSFSDPVEALAVLSGSEDNDFIDIFLYSKTFESAKDADIEKFLTFCQAMPPTTALAWNNLGNLFQIRLSRYEESEQAYKNAIELDSTISFPWNGLGNLYRGHLNRFNESEQAYKRALELDPTNALIWANLGGLCQYHLNQYEKSEMAYKKAVGLSPTDVSIWVNLGKLYEVHLNRYEDSERAYQKAIKFNPKNDLIWLNLGNLYQAHLKRYKDSEHAYKKAIKFNPTNPTAWFNLGILYQTHLNQYENSERAYKQTIEIDPTNADVWFNLAGLYQFYLNRYEDSEQAYKKAMELDPVSAYPWNGLGNLYEGRLNRYEESEQAYQKAIELDPTYAYPWNGLGNLYGERLNRYEESEQAYQKAIELDPTYAYPWNGLGNLYREHLNRYQDSERVYKKAIKLDPTIVQPWDGLGSLYQDHLNKDEDSKAAYLEAIKLDPDGSICKANLLWLNLKQKNIHRFKEQLESIHNLPFPGKALLLAAHDLIEGNPGLCCDRLRPVFEKNPIELWIVFRVDLLRLTRLIKNLGFDTFYLNFLKNHGFDMSLEPYAAAAQAFFQEKELLFGLNPEARTVAEGLYNWLISNTLTGKPDC